MEIKIENGIVVGSFTGDGNDGTAIVPEGVTVIGRRAFAEKRSLKKVILPNTVEKIEEEAFVCTGLTEITIPTSVETIGDRAFAECANLKKAIIPKNVKKIGDIAFGACLRLNELVIENDEIVLGNRAFHLCNELMDEDGFIIINKTLFGYKMKGKEVVKDFGGFKTYYIRPIEMESKPIDEKVFIPDGVEIIDTIPSFVRNIHLPDSVKQFREKEWRGICNLPKGLLQQDSKLDTVAIRRFVNSKLWMEEETDRDFAALYLFQSGKEFMKAIEHRLNQNPDQKLIAMCELIREKGKPSHCKKAADYYFQHKNEIMSETVNELYAVAGEKKAKKVVEQLEAYSGIKGGNSKAKPDAKKSSEPIEELCHEISSEPVVEKALKKFKLKESAFKGVKYRESGKKASTFVVACAILPYMEQLKEKPKSIGNYKKDYSFFEFDETADKIAGALEPESFRNVLDKLMGKDLPETLEVLIPYGRYASIEQLKTLNSRMKDWEYWDKYFAKGRKAIIIAHGAMMLNDTREALIQIEKLGLLSGAARARKVTEDTLRDTVLYNFGFDSTGKLYYDVGGTTIEVSLDKELKLQLYDVKNEKIVKTVPKKGNDAEKVEAVSSQISDAKRNIKRVVKSCAAELKKDFLHKRERKATDWKASYIGNPILKKIGGCIVWEAEDKSVKDAFRFMLCENDTLIGDDGTPVTLSENAKISVANPMNIRKEEVAAWQRYLKKNSIAQPFTQMFEPVYSADVEELKNRYKDIELPFFLIKNLEKEGFEVYGSREDGFGVRLGYGVKLRLFVEDGPIYTAKMIPIKSMVKLGEFHVSLPRNKMTRELNHALYLLDGLCFESMVRGDQIDAVVNHPEYLNEKNILRIIDVAEESKSTNCLAWLMDYKNSNFPDALDDLEL